ncbi:MULTISPECIES: GntR family transcriptional regulator [Streptomyces]|uniref:GntR family transcriptional regulator n=1 Tax=Streptomyces TaxID=1883 RepID=UPI000F7AA65B|nr:GntR family transcriptional regulator [Streptomyces sp. WAC05858]RSS33500.1 GntR family transcriptional regulator [Streptomyces sp. WAC05858]WTA79155.1 GntR family transcriptional regulator [Streptomyces antimycoticus]
MEERALHRRIADALVLRINRGDWVPGEQIPSRVDLAAEYNVHPQTVRLAVTLLRREGILEGEPRQRLFVAYPPAVRALTDPDGDWPYGCETIGTGTCRASEELAVRLDVPTGASTHWETVECWDPGGRSALLVTSWWRGRRRKHASAVVEAGTVRLDARQAQAFRLPMDTVALLLQRTRLDAGGLPVEVADLVLPADRWRLRL